MAKTYINTVKYEIKLKFEIDGIVDKPDIIGAIFGQSEGLLGDEMDLKELQKNGKIGRIEINHTTAMGRTKGTVIVPSSMDMAETSILAAGIESVDKVGPCEAKFEIMDIDDTRTNKREEIKDRAKELLRKMMEKTGGEASSISEEIKENARAAGIVNYGPDKLPAGPDVDLSQEVIVVEGRADVLNLLKNQIKNVIGMNGSNISKTIQTLSRRKELTVFIDGDRGGLLNARKLVQIAEVKYIAKAPDGKEVEELTRKEILQSLKKRVPIEEELSRERTRPGFDSGPRDRRPDRRDPRPGRMARGRSPRPGGERPGWGERKPMGRRELPERSPRPEYRELEKPVLTQVEEARFKPVLEELRGTMNARLLDEKGELVKELAVKDMVEEISKSKKKINAIIFDGVVTKRLVSTAEKAGVGFVIGARKGKIDPSQTVKATAL